MSQEPGRQMIIGVKDQNNDKLFFKMKSNGPIRKIWAAYCKRCNLEYRTVTFLLRGCRLRPNQTPDELKLKDRDVIEAMKPMLGGSYPPVR